MVADPTLNRTFAELFCRFNTMSILTPVVSNLLPNHNVQNQSMNNMEIPEMIPHQEINFA